MHRHWGLGLQCSTTFLCPLAAPAMMHSCFLQQLLAHAARVKSNDKSQLIALQHTLPAGPHLHALLDLAQSQDLNYNHLTAWYHTVIDK